MFNKRKVLIVGAGYVGSASAVNLALRGHDVYLADKSEAIITNWSNQTLPFSDNDLADGLTKLKNSKNVPKVMRDLSQLNQLDIILVCVGTPAASGKGYNLDQLKSAMTDVVNYLISKNQNEILIAIRSTLPPGCMQGVILPLVQDLWSLPTSPPQVVYFPEFLREGSALEDLDNAPLYIVGVDGDFDKKEWTENVFNIPANKLSIVKTGEAEMIKISSNIFHALKVCFANEIADCCTVFKIDSAVVMEKFCSDKKLNISPAYLKPGFSFGGPCLDKELTGLTEIPGLKSSGLPLLKSINSSNDSHFQSLLERIKKLNYSKIGILGLSFKEGSVDYRNSPVCKFISELKNEFQFFSFGETHVDVVSKEKFSDFLENIEVVLIGSATLTQEQVAAIFVKNIPVIDLGLNFNNKKFAKELKSFQSILSLP